MDNMKDYVQRQLVANVIKDKCANCDLIVFQESWCTQERCIRFTLPIFRALFPPKQNCSEWDSNDFVMFEVNNTLKSLEIICRFSVKSFPKEYQVDKNIILNLFSSSDNETIIKKQYNSNNPNDIFDFFDIFLNDELSKIESQIIKAFISTSNTEELEEGERKSIFSTKYERNRKARELCLSYYGRTCQKCGLNFEERYGVEFQNIIEVHHIVPLNEIGESYVVNPIRDLIPVCPNCHAMIHCEIKNGI